jgi:hypothetical protein
LSLAEPFACLGILRENLQAQSHFAEPKFHIPSTCGAALRPIYPVPVELLLGPLYTRSQGWSSTQIKHSYWCKSWHPPQGLYTRSQGWNGKKNLFNLPKVTNKHWTLWPCIGPKVETEKKIFSICPKLLINTELYGLVLAPRLKKRNPSNLGSQFASLVKNALTCSSNLGPNNKQKMLKVGPKFFQPWLLV